jgi:protein-S-isoprenylcysteine O-methyltransferase Ste14
MNISTGDTATGQRLDSPGIRIPPPPIYAAVFLVGLLLQWLFPLPFLPQPVALGVGAGLLGAWALLVISSIPTLVRRGGTLNTNAASARLVTGGAYRFSRNPIYLSLVLLYAGLACLFGVVWALILLPLLVVYTHVLVIRREERFLDRAFGEEYRAYKARVRPWI